MDKSDGISLSQIEQIGIIVQELEEAIGFCLYKPGWRFLFQVPEMIFFDCQDVGLLGTPAVSSSDIDTSVMYFKVEEIHSPDEALKDNGVRFVREPHLITRAKDNELWIDFFQNPYENLLTIMSEIPLTTEE